MQDDAEPKRVQGRQPGADRATRAQIRLLGQKLRNVLSSRFLSIILVSLSVNLVQSGRIFSAIVVPFRRMLSGPAVYVFGPLQLTESWISIGHDRFVKPRQTAASLFPSGSRT